MAHTGGGSPVESRAPAAMSDTDRSDPSPGPPPADGPPAAGSTAFDRLFLAIERELRGIAHRLLERNRRIDDVQTTVLVHNMYVKLRTSSADDWTSPDELLAASSTILRNLLTDAARGLHRGRRAAGGKAHDLEVVVEHFEGRKADGTAQTDLLDLDAALAALEKQQPQVGKMVELSYYMGVNEPEIARVFGVSLRTVSRKLAEARGYLKGYMGRCGRPRIEPPEPESPDVPT